MAKTTIGEKRPRAAEDGKHYEYQSAEPATPGAAPATGGGEALAAKKEKLFDAFEDLINTMTAGLTPATPAPPATPAVPATPTTPPAPSGGTPSPGTPSAPVTPGMPGGGEAPHPNGEASIEVPYALLRESYREDLTKAASRQAAAARRPGRPMTQEELDRKHTPDSSKAPFHRTQEFAPAYGNRGRGTGPTPEVVTAPGTGGRRPESAPAKPQAAGVMLDAYWGSFGTPAERAQERARIISRQRPEYQHLEAIIGADDRVLVTNNEAYPWRCICSLLITSATGLVFVGTGWLVSPRLVVTAGHCVYMADEGGWATQIEVIPGRFAENKPFGSAICRDLRSVTAWTVDNDRDYDYGAIMLPEDKRFGDDLGWFGYASRDDDYLRGVTLNLAGYPADGGKAGPERQHGTPWYHSRMVKDVDDRQLTYEIDTYGGQSGSPVWEMATDGSRYGLAIHTWGTSVNNGGTRITRQVFDNIVSWAGQVP